MYWNYLYFSGISMKMVTDIFYFGGSLQSKLSFGEK